LAATISGNVSEAAGAQAPLPTSTAPARENRKVRCVKRHKPATTASTGTTNRDSRLYTRPPLEL